MITVYESNLAIILENQDSGSLNQDFPRPAGQNRDPHGGGICREQRSNFLGPFHQTGMTAVKVFLQSEIKSLNRIVQTVKIKMIYRIAFRKMVFIYQGESRTGYLATDAHLSAKGLYQGGFSGTHLAVKGNYGMICK